MNSAIRAFVLSLLISAATFAQNPTANITVDANAARRSIDPRVYGLAYATTTQLQDLNVPLNRYGGNNTSRYNWQLNADNRANDWYYQSIGEPSAVAPVKPAVTAANARPRFSSGASADATPNAVGENRAAPNPDSARLNKTQCKSTATALSILPATKMPSAETSKSLRGQPPARAAMTGAATA